MSILWLIIKIILMTLLGICGLCLVIIGTILLVPIRYEAYLAKYEVLSYDIKITYLKGIKGIFYLDEEKKNHKLSLFGRVLYKNEDEKLIGNEEKDIMKSEESIASKKDEQSTRACERTQTKKLGSIQKPMMPKDEVAKKEKKINPQLKEEAKIGAIKTDQAVEEEAVETVEEMPSSWAKEIIFNQQTYSAIKQICKCIWRIAKDIFPYEWDFEVVVGKEDPADTGELIAKLTMLYPLYYRHGIIQGNYEKACLEGGFLIKGQFTIGCILWHIMRCILSQPVRQFIRLIMELRKEERNGK